MLQTSIALLESSHSRSSPWRAIISTVSRRNRLAILPRQVRRSLRSKIPRETFSSIPRWRGMSDAYDYFMSHAVAAVQKARAMPSSHLKLMQRTVARVYHLLAKESACAPNVHHLDDFRAAKRLQRQIDSGV
jgi:hypothetical protein